MRLWSCQKTLLKLSKGFVMGFRINTNIGAMNAHRLGIQNNRSLDTSLERLSSGLRINKAADDSSGLAIADSLRSQSSSLGQAINNANDAMGIIQTADKAMDEQVKILDTIKMKSIQAASDNQSNASRDAIQKDVNRLLEQLDNIAHTTSFNGRNLLMVSSLTKNSKLVHTVIKHLLLQLVILQRQRQVTLQRKILLLSLVTSLV